MRCIVRYCIIHEYYPFDYTICDNNLSGNSVSDDIHLVRTRSDPDHEPARFVGPKQWFGVAISTVSSFCRADPVGLPSLRLNHSASCWTAPSTWWMVVIEQRFAIVQASVVMLARP